MADVTDVHDAVRHATDSTIPDAVWSPTPNERPETVTEAPPEIGEFSAACEDNGASKLNTPSREEPTSELIVIKSSMVL